VRCGCGRLDGDGTVRNVVPGWDAGAVMVEFESELWVWAARRDDSWTFVSLPVDESEEIRELVGGLARGFGSVRVRAAIGGSSWRTSIFPDAGRRCYVLPVKKAIRTAERLDPGDTALVQVETVDV
jgi:uncharacterized protein DUF1905